MIRTWCKDHPIQFMACYLVFYLAFFKLLEQGIQVPDLVLHCRLDDLIPFCKYAIIPYYLWFAWIPCTLFYLLWFNDRREFWRLCLPLFTGMTLSLLFCAIVPNGTDLRPAYIYGNDIIYPHGTRFVAHGYAHQRVPVHPCVQLRHAGAGLSPLRTAARPQMAVGAPICRSALRFHHSFHHAVKAAFGD